MPDRCCEGLERTFDDKLARRELDDYRRHGPGATTRLLVKAVREIGVADMDVLDIGGGVGPIHHELLDAGARSIVDVDASAAYIAVARDEARRRGNEQRVTYLHGDFVEISADVQPADIVTLERVICCYPDMQALLGRAADHARDVVALVYPADRWWMRLGASVMTAFRRWTGTGFYVHRVQAIDAAMADAGFEARVRSGTFWWRVDAWARTTAAPGVPVAAAGVPVAAAGVPTAAPPADLAAVPPADPEMTR